MKFYQNIFKKLLDLNTRVYGLSRHFLELKKILNFKTIDLANFLNTNVYSIKEYEDSETGIRLDYLVKIYKRLNRDKMTLIQKLLRKDVQLKICGSNIFFNFSFYKKEPKNPKLEYKGMRLNIWNTDFRVIISKNMIKELKKNIKKAGGMFVVTNLTNMTRDSIYRLLSGKGSSVRTYYNLTNFLRMDLEKAENNIMGLTYNGSKFTYPFIKNMNLLLFRIICHVIGDGTIASKHTCRWIQHKKNSLWLQKLIIKEIGFSPTISDSTSKTCDVVTISAYFSRLLNYMLGVDIRKMKDAKTIERFLKLPKEYRLQLLAAFIVDEGHIRYKKAKSCVISQSNKDMIGSFSKILNSLDYTHSEIKEEIDKNNHKAYRINIYMDGMIKLNKDLNKIRQQYGELSGLWHKQADLENYIKSIKRRK